MSPQGRPPLYPKPAPKTMIQNIKNKQDKLKALLNEKKRKVQLVDKILSEIDVLDGKIIQITGSIDKSISSYRKK